MANAPSPNDLTRQQLDELDALLQRMLALPAAKPAAPLPAPKPVPMPEPVPTPTAAIEVPPPAAWRTDRPAGPPAQSPHLTAATALEPEPADVLEALAGITRTNTFAIPATPSEPVVVAPGAITSESAAPYATGPAGQFAPTVPPTPAEPFVTNRLFGPPTPDTGVLPADATPTDFDPVALRPHGDLGRTANVPDFVPLELRDMGSTSNGTIDIPAEVITSSGDTKRVPMLLWPLYAVNWVLERGLGVFGPPGQALTSPGMKYVLGAAGILMIAAAGAWTARGMGWIELPWPRL